MTSLKLSLSTPPKKRLNSVIIIDDSSTELQMAIDYFSKYPGLKTKTYATGELCIKDLVVSGFVPDMILLDYFLDSESPGSKDGLEVLVKLAELCPTSEIIMLSAVENQRVIDLARRKGASYYIVKGAAGYKKLDEIISKDFIVGG
ncbi:MAG: response regulator [Bacteroidetes bacterium]|nr:MAG: response regulator [Bacteroidota bacterium]